ncbi:RING-type domain-containing protein, partial [Aphis craccivora]
DWGILRCDETACFNGGDTCTAILEEEARRFPNAAIEVSREQALRTMRYVRRSVNPPTPNNLRAMGEIIVSPTWQSRLLYSVDDNAPFFHGNLEFIVNEKLIFLNLAFLRRIAPYLREAKVLAIDGTFGVVPRVPADAEQLITMHAVLDNVSVPVVYALLNRRTENVYIGLWQYVRNNLPEDIFDWQNVSIVSDFETAMRNAIQRVIPECQLIGCWFHFCQSILRFVHTHGMVTLFRENHHAATILKMIMSLPHLPSQQMPELPEDFHILGGFLAIIRLETRMGVLNRIVQLVDYVRQYWLTTVLPSGFSVYGVNIRTNNFVESFHSMLKSTIGIHPPIWSFYDRLRSVESRVRRKTLQTINGQQCLAETQITAFWLMLYETYTMAYLRRVSYSVRGYIDMQIGPLANEILLEDFIPGQLPMVGLQPLPPVWPPFHIRGAGRPRRGRGRQRAAAVPENHGMVRHPNVCQQPGGGNIGLIEDHHLLGNTDNIEVPIQIQANNEDRNEPLDLPENEVDQPDIDDTLAEEEVYEIVELGIDDAFVDEQNTQPAHQAVDLDIPTFEGDPVDRCFICLESWGQVNSANILVPCSHGWCCDECANRLDKCGVCKVEFPTTQPIHIMHVNLGDGKWMPNNSLLDLTGSQCLGCMRHVQYVPDQAQYILLDCGHGWYCASCISTPPATCDVCGDMV